MTVHNSHGWAPKARGVKHPSRVSERGARLFCSLTWKGSTIVSVPKQSIAREVGTESPRRRVEVFRGVNTSDDSVHDVQWPSLPRVTSAGILDSRVRSSISLRTNRDQRARYPVTRR